MAIETLLTTVLKSCCERTYPDVAPTSTPRPYITYQLIGGPALRWLSGAAADKRRSLVQINIWADTRLSAQALCRQVEEALVAATTLKAWPDGEPRTDYDHDMQRYGAMQEFHIYSAR